MPITLRLSGFSRAKYRSCQISRCRGRNRLRSIAIVAPATLHRPSVMLSKGERYRLHLDCIIIKRHKGRSEVKRLLTIAEDSRLIAYITREVTLYIYVYLFLSLIAESSFIIMPVCIFFVKSNFSSQNN